MEDLNHYLSSEALIHLLVKTVSNGGNLCLNVGPTADGRIPVIQQQRLLDIGQWLMVNGDAIYGTKHWKNEPTKSPDSPLHFTQNNTNLYAILTSWSQKPIEIEKVEKPTSVVLLGYNGVVKYKWAKQKLTIYPPLVSPSQHKITAAWSFKIENALN